MAPGSALPARTSSSRLRIDDSAETMSTKGTERMRVTGTKSSARYGRLR